MFSSDTVEIDVQAFSNIEKLKKTHTCELKNLPLENYTDLLENLITEDSVGVLAGPTEAGKSIIALQLALLVAGGQKQFLDWNIKKTGRVLWIDYELTAQQFTMRMKKQQLSGEHLDVLIKTGTGETIENMLPRLKRDILEKNYVLVVIDNLTFAHHRDSNIEKDACKVARTLKSIAIKCHCCVLAVMHFRKGAKYEVGGTDSVRGSSAYIDACDLAINFTRSGRDEFLSVLTITKCRNYIPPIRN